jgi:hypothetical protein
MIDPAQSFSNALGQGLGIMKSFRDEKRLDEDRAFTREQVAFDQNMKERQFKLMVNQDQRAGAEETRNAAKFAEDMSPERVAARGRLLEGQADSATAQAKDATVLADNRQNIIDTDILVSKSNAQSNRISANASARNATTNAGELAFKQQVYNEERTQKNYLQSIQSAFPLITQPMTRENFAKIQGNPAAAAAVFQMAGAVSGSRAVEEALRNPSGDWINDPLKFKQVANFSRATPIFGRAVKDYGFGRDARLTGLRSFDRNNIELSITGTRNGRVETKKLYVRPNEIFEPAAVAANVFRGIDRDPQAKARLAQTYGVADKEGFNAIMSEELKMLEGRREILARSRMNANAVKQIDATLERVNAGDPVVIGEIVFNRLAQIAGQ